MTFDNWTNPEVITAICIGIATIIGAIATIFKGKKSWKELLTNINKEELKVVSKTIEEQAKIIKNIVNKEKSKSQKE